MNDFLTNNRALIEKHHPELLGLDRGGIDPLYQVIDTPAGPVSLTAPAGGKPVTLHSRFDPLKEASAWAEQIKYDGNRLPVILGLGLGYHLQAALEKLPLEAKFAVVEADRGVFRAALELTDLGPLLNHPGLLLLVGLSQEETLHRLTRWQIENDWSPFQTWPHRPSMNLRSGYYGFLYHQLQNSTLSDLRPQLIYPRLKKERLKILIFNTGYYLIREIQQALHCLGHQVCLLTLADSEYGAEDTMPRLLAAVAEFKPDFTLTVNHLGFDQEGIMADMLASLKLPLASWFVDSPRLILGQGRHRGGDNSSIFLWDAQYLEPVRDLGYDHVHFLPLATDENVFRPLNKGPSPLAHLACSTGFVGDSMSAPIRQCLRRLNLPPAVRSLAEQTAGVFSRGADRDPRQIWQDLVRSSPALPPDFDSSSWLELEALITWRATQIRRQETVQALAPLRPVIVGDPGWLELLDRNLFRLEPPLDYYNDLPKFYPLCQVNLNVTSQQMKTGVNQRVFDVPASGAFLLTDFRPQLETLFELDREVICYRHSEEALDLARYYLNHESERLAVAARGRERVLAQHTYYRRLAVMIDLLRQDHCS